MNIPWAWEKGKAKWLNISTETDDSTFLYGPRAGKYSLTHSYSRVAALNLDVFGVMKEAAVAGKDIEDNQFNVYSASIRCWVMHLYHPQFQEPLLCNSGVVPTTIKWDVLRCFWIVRKCPTETGTSKSRIKNHQNYLCKHMFFFISTHSNFNPNKKA